MSGLLVTLPLHLACNLIAPLNSSVFGNVTFVEDTSALNQSFALPEGYTAFPDIGLAYKYYGNRVTWNAARKQCIMEGGNLAVIDSFKKVQYAMGVKDRSASVHSGVHRLFNSVEWISVKSGQPLGFIPWKPDADLKAGTGGCVAVWYDGTGLSPWDCAKVLPAVCEIPILRSHRNKARICQEGTGDQPSRDTEIRVDGDPQSNVTRITIS